MFSNVGNVRDSLLHWEPSSIINNLDVFYRDNLVQARMLLIITHYSKQSTELHNSCRFVLDSLLTVPHNLCRFVRLPAWVSYLNLVYHILACWNYKWDINFLLNTSGIISTQNRYTWYRTINSMAQNM